MNKEQFITMAADKLDPQAIMELQSKLPEGENDRYLFALQGLKNPTTALILSVLTGLIGVDRFYIGDTGLGIGKLLTVGGCGIWALIDLFLISNATKKKNYEKLMMTLR